jgi:serine phosphatase RsbU (regulator of sigma subunit)
MDISLCSINTETLEMQWAGANNPCIIIKDNELIKLEADKMPIAIFDKMDKFTLHEIQLQKNDIIYLASDGFSDQFGGPDNRKFMSNRFKELLLTISGKSMSEQKVILDGTIEEWKNSNNKKYEQTDDITVMGLKIL